MAKQSSEGQLKASLSDAIDAFASNRMQILKDAFAKGGDAEVNQVLNEYDTLRDSYYQLIKSELDANNAQYSTLTKAAKSETDALNNDIKGLKDIATIITDIGDVINIIGRVVSVLAVV